MRRTVYTEKEFNLLVKKGKADMFSCYKTPFVKDNNDNWQEVRIIYEKQKPKKGRLYR